jgi:hypothetical protein
MTPTQLDQIITEAPDRLRSVIGELHTDILAASAAAISDAEDGISGGKPKVVVGLRLVIALNSSTPSWHVEASVGRRVKAVSEINQTDEATPELMPAMGKDLAGKAPVKAISDLHADGATLSVGGES